MPQGEGTYGKQVGRPAKKKNNRDFEKGQKVMSMKGKDKESFKPHMMYCKDGSSKKAKTYQEHLKLKKKGCGHSKKEVMKMDYKK
tara:strand:+ start:71 stop:325 length:255 start_codon:yes stop_codon:yes gene_type:complete